MPPEVAIIVPVFNEADNITPLTEEVLAAMGGQGRTFELVFVDDASTDETWIRIRKLAERDARVRGLRHVRNAGQSAALWTGFQASHSRLLATLDGDLQNDPADLPRLLAELDTADFVSGVRVKRYDGWVRRLSSSIARRARRAMLQVDFQDTGCALRAFKRTALEGVLPFNGFHRILPVLVHHAGVVTREVPASHRARAFGVSKYGVWNRLGRGVYDLIGLRWYLGRKLKQVPVEHSGKGGRTDKWSVPFSTRKPG
jgi:glycosyltransferase involved in cell wall biosynthesis